MSGRRARRERQEALMAAAEQESRRVLVAVGAHLDRPTFTEGTDDHLTDWERGLLRAALDEREIFRTCGHADRPVPFILFGHRADQLRCAVCARAEGLRLKGTAEDHTCDICREVWPGLLLRGLRQLGPVLISVGLCEACSAAQRTEREAIDHTVVALGGQGLAERRAAS